MAHDFRGLGLRAEGLGFRILGSGCMALDCLKV